MTKRHYKKSYYPKKMTKEEIFRWAFVAVVFAFVFVCYFTYSFFTHCIFEWPIRWDVKTCWSEQVDPSTREAAEKAAIFAP